MSMLRDVVMYTLRGVAVSLKGCGNVHSPCVYWLVAWRL